MIGGNNYSTGVTADFFADDTTDVTNLEQFARDNNLQIGSTCYVVATGDLYMMKSDYTWVKQ